MERHQWRTREVEPGRELSVEEVVWMTGVERIVTTEDMEPGGGSSVERVVTEGVEPGGGSSVERVVTEGVEPGGGSSVERVVTEGAEPGVGSSVERRW